MIDSLSNDEDKNSIRREKKRQYNNKRVAKGLCVYCPNEHIPGLIYCQECKAKSVERNRKRREKHRSKGVCVECLKPVVEGKSKCQYHIDLMAASAKKMPGVYEAKGMCRKCGKYPPLYPLRVCLTCNEKGKLSWEKARQNLKNKGICPTCKKPTDTVALCQECKRNLRQYFAEKQQQWKDAGFCQWCGTCQFEPGYSNKTTKFCSECYFKSLCKRDYNKNNSLHWTQLMELFNSQQKCPYTGRLLQIGFVSLDHIVPRSRGGLNELSNLQFVYLGDDVDVNMLKWDKTHDEFVDIIRLLYSNLTCNMTC